MKQEEIINLTQKYLNKYSIDIPILVEHIPDAFASYTEEIYSTGLRKPLKITMSPILVNYSKRKIKNVILHEIAHVLVGSENDHNSVWRKKCIEIGGNGLTSETNTEHIVKSVFIFSASLFVFFACLLTPVFFTLDYSSNSRFSF